MTTSKRYARRGQYARSRSGYIRTHPTRIEYTVTEPVYGGSGFTSRRVRSGGAR